MSLKKKKKGKRSKSYHAISYRGRNNFLIVASALFFLLFGRGACKLTPAYRCSFLQMFLFVRASTYLVFRT